MDVILVGQNRAGIERGGNGPFRAGETGQTAKRIGPKKRVSVFFTLSILG
jgi:hypothetical protein